MPSNEYAPKSWASRDFEFELPSGDKCLLRKMSPLDLVKFGLQDKLDFVTTVVMKTHVKNGQRSNIERIKAQRAKAAAIEPTDEDTLALKDIMSDPEKMTNFEEVLDQVVLFSVVAPKMHTPPENDEDRENGVFYTDAVPFDDKMAIFNKLMEGVKKAEQFRDGSEEAVGAVASQPSVRKPTKRTASTTRKRSTG